MAEEEEHKGGDFRNLSDAGPSGCSTDIIMAPGASAIEERCPICLDDYQDKAFIATCFHILKLCVGTNDVFHGSMFTAHIHHFGAQ